LALTASDPVSVFGRAVRRSIDEVLDGPRTGRWSFAQLEKTEKTYVGTKVEIVVRASLGLEPGPVLDLEIEGRPVDVKWAMNSVWQIPQEAIGELCLCMGGLAGMTQFQVGLLRCDEARLNPGENRDRKRTVSADGRRMMRMLVEPAAIPPNFVAEMDPTVRADVMSRPTIQGRITALFQMHPYMPVPRSAVRTIARTEGDPMRRLRADTLAGDPLEGMRLLSSQYGNAIVEALGHPRLSPGSFMSVPQRDIDGLSNEVRMRLPASARKRFGLD
jgi:hypothetical protein